MKLTAVGNLLPTDNQLHALRQTLESANAACNRISAQAWQAMLFARVPVHKLTYYHVREQYQLTAQMAVRCIGKVVDGYKLDQRKPQQFKPHGAIAYDDRILNWRVANQQVSIWMLNRRETVNFTCGEHHLALLHYQQGETDLVYRKGKFYLYTTCNVPDDTPLDPEGWIGADLGITNLLTDSDGEIYSARHLLNARHRYRRLRKKLQKKGTKSAKRLLVKRSGREQRFAEDVNHSISKRLVEKAKDTTRGIGLEDLTHLRERVTVQRRRRDPLHSWNFHSLRFKIVYQAALKGVPVRVVDPRYPSQACSCCGHISRSNRPNQATFNCPSCGFVAHADVNAAVKMSRRAALNQPYADSVLGLSPA